MPFMTNTSNTATRKVQQYEELSNAYFSTYQINIITLEIGSSGFLCMEGFKQLYKLLWAKAKDSKLYSVT